ncbi:MAG: GHKL domain-containing protein [Ruminococcus flavefaciens]|nr:GHKL domain-containing protein [Ruminococcus flavefaciens]
MLEEQYRLAERLRHDLKNHIFALTGLLEQNEYNKMRNYLKSMEKSAGFTETEETTGNRITDVLLSQKGKLARQKGILWECGVQLPKPCPVSDFDLCVLFGNILDNAMEACTKIQDSPAPPFIRIQGQLVKHCFLLEVKNSTNARQNNASQPTNQYLPQKQPDIKFASSCKTGHGIGLLNVRDTADKYNGTVNTNLQDGIFTISVLIPLDSAAHNGK